MADNVVSGVLTNREVVLLPWWSFLLIALKAVMTEPAFMKLTTTPTVRAMTFTKQVFQDIVLPINKLEEQINTSHQLFDTYPILVYPCRIYDHGPHTGAKIIQ